MTDPAPIEMHLLGPDDQALLGHVAPGVFDGPLDPARTAEFLTDTRHHLAAALDAEQVVGMASAVHYVHPDKAPELWINEVGVAPSHQRRGIGRALLDTLFTYGRTLGCGEAWVLTEADNTAARRLYASAGGSEDDQVVCVTFQLD